MKKIICLVIFWSVVAIAPAFASRQVDAAMKQGDELIKRGDFATASDVYSRLRVLYDEGDRSERIAVGLHYAGNCYAFCHRYVEALEFYVIACKAATETGHDNVKRGCLNNIGMIYSIYNEYERGAHYFRRAYEEARNADDYELTYTALSNLIFSYCYLGNVDEAKHAKQLLTDEFTKDDVGEKHLYQSLYSNGLIAAAENDYRRCANYMRSALSMRSLDEQQPAFVAEAMLKLAFAYENLGRPDSAKYYYLQCAGFSERSDNPAQLAAAWRSLASLYSHQGQADSAAFFSGRWIAITDSVFNPLAFNHAKERLLKYEESVMDNKVNTLTNNIRRQKFWIVFIMIILGLTICLLVGIYTSRRRLRRTRQLLISKNDELIRQNELLSHLNDGLGNSIVTEAEAGEEATKNNQYSQTPIQRERLLSAIGEIMRRREVITNPELTLTSLSKMAGSNSKYVSQVINETYGKNFKSFLNEYRIREACELMADDEYMERHTMASLAADIGFISVNTFTSAFKRVMGMTPSTYRKLKKE